TGCMKLMINGALTIGTLDGANIEMRKEAGEDNMFIFGLECDEVDDLWTKGYRAQEYYHTSAALHRTIDRLYQGFAGESFADIANYLISAGGIADPYMCLADFESYKAEHDRAISIYPNQKRWNKMSINNIAGAGEFAADRSIDEYAERIWNLERMVKNGK
ncbi:MAG: glycogen/starch/alpha-glucan phosphorylase, partial [Clostridia bacterium]|nr:glycogen/starch/alpha-glucan phosphorylase [Clostridia bacterium]